MPQHALATVEFVPQGRKVQVEPETLLSEALWRAEIPLPQDCGGGGTCGRCQVWVEGPVSPPESAEDKLLDPGDLAQGLRLACQTRVRGDVKVRVPQNADLDDQGWSLAVDRQGGWAIAEPAVRALDCQAPEPSLADHRADLERLLAALPGLPVGPGHAADFQVAGQITQMAREQAWRLALYLRGREVVGAAPAGAAPLGLAVDLGSTKLAGYLLDLRDGRLLAAKGLLNPQVVFGADVVTRLHRAISQPQDGQRLTRAVRRAVNGLAGDLARQAGVGRARIAEAVLVGNTAMIHLFLGWPLRQLASPPFVSCLASPLDAKARDLGLELAPGAYLHLPPLVGGFVGSDNVAMVLGAGLDQPGQGLRLGLDIGTNTEIVLSLPQGQRPLLIASAPSGPTFEGAHLSSGMRAVAGAIGKVRVAGDGLECQTVDGSPALGICGSGIIDIVAQLLEAGILDRRGHLRRDSALVDASGPAPRVVLVPAERSASGRDIAITQADISQVQLAKAAIRAATQTLLALAGRQVEELGEVVLAGSFGSHIDLESARRIGLLPRVAGAAYTQAGNCAGQGAQQALVSLDQRRRAAAIPGLATYVELAKMPEFNTFFARYLGFGDEAA